MGLSSLLPLLFLPCSLGGPPKTPTVLFSWEGLASREVPEGRLDFPFRFFPYQGERDQKCVKLGMKKFPFYGGRLVRAVSKE